MLLFFAYHEVTRSNDINQRVMFMNLSTEIIQDFINFNLMTGAMMWDKPSRRWFRSYRAWDSHCTRLAGRLIDPDDDRVPILGGYYRAFDLIKAYFDECQLPERTTWNPAEQFWQIELKTGERVVGFISVEQASQALVNDIDLNNHPFINMRIGESIIVTGKRATPNECPMLAAARHYGRQHDNYKFKGRAYSANHVELTRVDHRTSSTHGRQIPAATLEPGDMIDTRGFQAEVLRVEQTPPSVTVSLILIDAYSTTGRRSWPKLRRDAEGAAFVQMGADEKIKLIN